MIPASDTYGDVPDDIHKTEYSEIRDDHLHVHRQEVVETEVATSQEHLSQPKEGNQSMRTRSLRMSALGSAQIKY